METSCQTCGTKLKIPDEKLPKGKVINIVCPKCKGEVSIDTATTLKEPEIDLDVDSSGLDSEEATSEAATETTISAPAGEMTDQFFGDDEKTALICDDSQPNQDMLSSALKELGYRVSTGTNPNDVLDKMRYNHYDLIVLDEGLGGKPPSENPILNQIQSMPIATRRNIFFALIGPDYSTLDNMMAFAKSANVVINEKDLPRVKTILSRSISDNERFYKVFKETLRAIGKV
ncbi:MAG: hypothetical protein ABID54_01160 [Pseudomonadota bacterium]